MSGKQGRPSTWRSRGLGGSDGWSNGWAISKLADDGSSEADDGVANKNGDSKNDGDRGCMIGQGI